MGDFRAQLKNAAIELTAASEDYKVKLNVKSIKSPVLQGDSGISVKGKQPGEASLYISLTRLLGDGELEIAGKKRSIVHASLWLDHEVMSTQVTSTSKGWDWFGIQLQDGREIMVYNLRENSVKTEFSYGSVIEKDGRIHKLRGSDFNIDVLDDWTSPLTGKRYPSRFRLTIPSISESFEIIPTVAQQELVTNRTTNVTYWEGRATVEKAGERAGNAYVELVGY